MPQIMILADSGFGKTASIGPNPEFGIIGLDKKDTYIVSATSKDLTFPKSRELFPITTVDALPKGSRVVTSSPKAVLKAIRMLTIAPHIKNIILDDFNYIMQKYYMANALAKGWDTPKAIGFDMGLIFDAIEEASLKGKNVIILAHGEVVEKEDGRKGIQLKTTGKMVREYMTPEGLMDVLLLGFSRWDSNSNKVVKEYITRETELYASAKSSTMFSEAAILNDLHLVVEAVNTYYGTTK